MSTRPTIGIVTSTLARTDGTLPNSYQCNVRYVQALTHCRCTPILIPLIADHDYLASVIDQVDGLMLIGGPDVDPRWYREEPHPKLGATDPAKDEVETLLVPLVLNQDKPLLGICRGPQVINVALGGSLYQDLRSQMPGCLAHSQGPSEQRNRLSHTVSVLPDSRLAAILGTEPLLVNSLHHQAISKLGMGLRVSAIAPDGVIEAVESPSHRFLIAVQFHPEELYAESSAMAAIFTAFAAACAGD